MIKGSAAQTFLVDIFRVKGGGKHDFRIFSEIGASDSPDNSLEFIGVDLPEEKLLPDYGGSIEHEHIYGLRDVRTAKTSHPGWRAIWREKDRSFRMWMLSASDRVEASHGPGQMEYLRQLGRRLRYVDTINEGEDIASTFVAIHEPTGTGGIFPIKNAEMLDTHDIAGDNAIAVKIESLWGKYLLLSEFENECEIEGVKFKGKFGLVKIAPDGKHSLIACSSSTLKYEQSGFENEAEQWSGKVKEYTRSELLADNSRPDGFPPVPDNCLNYVLVDRGKRITGYSVGSMIKDRITVQRFSFEAPTRFVLPALRVLLRY